MIRPIPACCSDRDLSHQLEGSRLRSITPSGRPLYVENVSFRIKTFKTAPRRKGFG
jgi:hypothetical protein